MEREGDGDEERGGGESGSEDQVNGVGERQWRETERVALYHRCLYLNVNFVCDYYHPNSSQETNHLDDVY